MEKDITILDFIKRLKLIVNFNLLEVVDYWEAYLCAVGLKKGNHLVYISTFNYADKVIMKYDFDLEIILSADNGEKLKVVKTGRSVSESELVGEIRLFLKI